MVPEWLYGLIAERPRRRVAPGLDCARGSHGSGRAGLPHPALRSRVSPRTDGGVDGARRGKRMAAKEVVEPLPAPTRMPRPRPQPATPDPTDLGPKPNERDRVPSDPVVLVVPFQ